MSEIARDLRRSLLMLASVSFVFLPLAAPPSLGEKWETKRRRKGKSRFLWILTGRWSGRIISDPWPRPKVKSFRKRFRTEFTRWILRFYQRTKLLGFQIVYTNVHVFVIHYCELYTCSLLKLYHIYSYIHSSNIFLTKFIMFVIYFWTYIARIYVYEFYWTRHNSSARHSKMK